ncbi:hypothetical protein [Vibrio metschnikovii]|uniref:hypothetical protein n=1 Tax=Vibrio metschnikovii TaxID=28172 RepID=UPI001C308112|nr:hypothetical protein [Vibrio metschnikovii]
MAEVVNVDGEAALTRTGRITPTSQGNESRKLAEYVLTKLRGMGYKASFDVSHNNGDGHFAVFEFCGALGGVSIRYMDYAVHQQVLSKAMDSVDKVMDFCDMIRSSATPDKYKLRRALSQPQQVAFLAGSNCLRVAIDFDKVAECVANGGMVKPHPITHERHIFELKQDFPKAIMPLRVAGGSLIPDLEKAYIPTTSELNFVAIAHGVPIVDISSHDNWEAFRSCYASYVDQIQNSSAYSHQDALNTLFSSPKSGLFFSKEDVDNNIMNYVKEVEETIRENLFRSTK